MKKYKEIIHSYYRFDFEGEKNWTDFFTKFGKEMDKRKVPIHKCTKIIWENGEIQFYLIKAFEVDLTAPIGSKIRELK